MPMPFLSIAFAPNRQQPLMTSALSQSPSPAKIVVLLVILFLAAIAGAFDNHIQEPEGFIQQFLFVLPPLLGLGLMFVWLRYDSSEIGFRRSVLLNIGIVGMTIIFVPVYLFKSRSIVRRGKAILLFFGFVILCISSYLFGAWIAARL